MDTYDQLSWIFTLAGFGMILGFLISFIVIVLISAIHKLLVKARKLFFRE